MTTTRDKKYLLKDVHPYLYRRVKLKAVVHLLLGIAILLSLTGVQNRTELVGYLPYEIWGLIFIILGSGIAYSLWRNNPTKTKTWLLMAFVHALLWLTALVVSAILNGISGLSIIILWGYLTYNLWYLVHDTGWEGAELVREYREAQNER